MKKILMVCLGNICRSPLAEGIMQDKINKLNLEAIVDSAGTSAWHEGEAPDSRAQQTARKHGINIGKLKARKFQASDFQNFDIIYVMDKQNYSDVLTLAKNEEEAKKVEMILNESNPGSFYSVPDPYFGGDDGFESVFKMLDDACISIAKKL